MNDFLGQDLAVGDHVLVGSPAGLALGVIVKFSPKMVQVDLNRRHKKPVSCYSETLCKLTSEQVMWHLLNRA